MWPIGSSRYSQNLNSKAFRSLPVKIGMMPKLFIGVLKKEKKREMEKDNQYKLKKAMAIAIGLISFSHNVLNLKVQKFGERSI